jgi:hypothetical protein
MARRGRKAIGMGTILLLGGAAWWLLGRRGADAYPSHLEPGQLPTDKPLEAYSADRELMPIEVQALRAAGRLPADATRAWVHADVEGVQKPMMPGWVGAYLISPAVAASLSQEAPSGAVAGYGSLLYPTGVYATPLAAGGGPSITPGLWY